MVQFQAPNCPVPPPDLVIENAQFMFTPNFEGREETFNKAGDRYFNVRIPDNIVKELEEQNWNLNWTKPKDDERQPEPFLKVAVGFQYRPPYISVFEDGKETVLTVDEKSGIDTVKIVDVLQFEKMDVVIRGRAWKNEASGNCGIKAWLKTFVGIVEYDDIRRKYARQDD